MAFLVSLLNRVLRFSILYLKDLKYKIVVLKGKDHSASIALFTRTVYLMFNMGTATVPAMN